MKCVFVTSQYDFVSFTANKQRRAPQPLKTSSQGTEPVCGSCSFVQWKLVKQSGDDGSACVNSAHTGKRGGGYFVEQNLTDVDHTLYLYSFGVFMHMRSCICSDKPRQVRGFTWQMRRLQAFVHLHQLTRDTCERLSSMK